jgi:polysaccharide deacetylase family protein (PEP-CTERM system associated)
LNPVTFTIDLEDPTERYEPDSRYVGLTYKILDLFDEHNVKATFFAIGKIAQAAPQLIRDIAAKGHEIAYHSHAHLSLTDETPSHFASEVREDKYRLQQLTGSDVIGFRAPRYSLTPQSAWALDVLAENGFRYSSSIMPTKISRFGFPDTPKVPFKWPCGLTEFPMPVKEVGPLSIPFMGGVYLYALPSFLTDRWREEAPEGSVLWTYAHPYDFDPAESYMPMPHTPLWVSAILWAARQRAGSKIGRLLRDKAAGPLKSQIL